MTTQHHSTIYQYAECVISGLINDVKAMVLTEVRGQSDTILELRVASADVGKVLGRGGQTAAAIRLLLYAFAKKNGESNITITFRVLNTRDNTIEKPAIKREKYSW